MRGRRRKLIGDPNHWRARAAELRMVAAQVSDPKVKATTSGAADGFDKVAHLGEAKATIPARRLRTGENSI
jgi:hypothetical protein